MASDNPDEWWQHSPEGQQKNSPSGQWQQGYRSQGGQPDPGVQWGRTAGQGPQPTPPQGAWEVPPLGGAGGYGGPPAKNNGPLIAVLVTVVVLVLVGVIGLVVLQSRGSEENTAAGTSSEVTDSARPSASTTATSTTATTSALPSSGEPVLREGVAPVAVLGPTWQAGESTYTMAFQGWPFAFRAPGSWGCMKGSIEKIPDAQAWGCVDESNSAAGQRVNLILRKCPATCDAATRTQFNADWFDQPDQARAFDDRTSYVEAAVNDEGRYSVDFSRFFAAEPGGEPVWQVGVFVESPAAGKDVVLKTLNDVATQTQ
ncbi:hypothetical protein [Nocardia jinanensis]|uniref:Uncharacterized protein n=1 Tax=Nocardia jinanensis TaxID=382504 RepID=A0A917RE73_9NOCA|nr:hypothetical protein [Nocardia jinanensis]GGL04221.1 hypothetical protein GCM10011588_18590 [Nocardia jinanensis]